MIMHVPIPSFFLVDIRLYADYMQIAQIAKGGVQRFRSCEMREKTMLGRGKMVGFGRTTGGPRGTRVKALIPA